jgi:hypothetical protein
MIGFSKICSYWGYFSTENIIDSYTINEDFEAGYSDFNSEYALYHLDGSRIFDKISESINEILPDLVYELQDSGLKSILDITHSGFSSPKYYNFSGDRFYLDFEVNWPKFQKQLKKIAAKNSAEFSDFLRDNYSSRDGFISFTANNLDQWIQDLESGDVTAAAAFLTWFIHSKIDLDFSFLVYENFSENSFYPDFIDMDSLEEAINDIKAGQYFSGIYPGIDQDMESNLIIKYLDINPEYMRPAAEIAAELTEKFPEIEIDWLPIIEKKFRDIDSHTLSLF